MSATLRTPTVLQRLEHVLLKSWRNPNALTLALLPLSALYWVCATCNRWRYTHGFANRRPAPVATLVVGNLTVGGSGKSPLVAALVNVLQGQGFRVGVVSRGYKSKAGSRALLLDPDSDPRQVGDEPYMLFLQTRVPIAVGADRHAAIKALLERHALDLIVSDDGLQHWALQPKVTLCIDDQTDASRNHWLLPAGPYRESRSRLKAMDEVITHVLPDTAKLPMVNDFASDSDRGFPRSQFWLEPQAVRLVSTLGTVGTSKMQGEQVALDLVPSKVNLVAGIAKPERFFSTATDLGFTGPQHYFSDHHDFCAADLEFDNDWPILMTEKDAVKCRSFASERLWFLPVRAQIEPALVTRLVNRLRAEASL